MKILIIVFSLEGLETKQIRKEDFKNDEFLSEFKDKEFVFSTLIIVEEHKHNQTNYIRDFLLRSTHPNDTVITSSLINVSRCLDGALYAAKCLAENNVRLISVDERFDSYTEVGRGLIDGYEIIGHYNLSLNHNIGKRRQYGIKQAQKNGTHIGKRKLEFNSFTNFTKYYEQWKNQEITKVQFATKLKISRPTLDKLIKEYIIQTQKEK